LLIYSRLIPIYKYEDLNGKIINNLDVKKRLFI